MSVPTFAALLSEHLNRAGISDTELARSIGVRRQTVFRWKEGLVERPRSREDVLRCARKLRLTAAERDLLLLAAGFAPEELSAEALRESLLDDEVAATESEEPSVSSSEHEDVAANAVEGHGTMTEASELDDGANLSAAAEHSVAESVPDTFDDEPDMQRATKVGSSEPATDELLVVSADPEPTAGGSIPLRHWMPQKLLSGKWVPEHRRYLVLGLLTLLVLFFFIAWQTLPTRLAPVVPTPTQPVVQMTLNPPKTTARPAFPLVHPIAQPGETLLIVAPFDGYTVNEQYNVAGRIQEALNSEITNARLVSTTIEIWPEKIRDSAYLQEVLSASDAALVIWGEYDSGRVRVNLNGKNDLAQQRDFTLSSPSELITTITNTLPKEIQVLALIAVGRLLRDREEYTGAATALNRALTLRPGDEKTRALVNFYLGHLAERAADLRGLTRAIRYYETALSENPRLYDAQYNLGTVYLNRSYLYPAGDEKILLDLDASIEQLSAVIGVHPSYQLAHHNRGVARYERHRGNDLVDAVNDFTYVIAVDAENSRAYFHRALTTIRMGESMQWVADLEKTLQLTPDYYPAYNGLCWGYALAQEAQQALPYCDKAVARDETGASHDSRAIVYTQLERYAEAAADFTAYLTWIEESYGPRLYERYRGPQVEEWIDAVNQGENPFTSELLASLR